MTQQYCTPFRKGEDKGAEVEDPDGEVLSDNLLA